VLNTLLEPRCFIIERGKFLIKIPTLSIPEFEKLDNAKSIKAYRPKKEVEARAREFVKGPKPLEA
jgi:hypothetical protein